MIKKIIKLITPPIVLETVKGIVHKPVVYSPIWNTFSYEPLRGIKMYFDPQGPWQKKLLSSEYDRYIFDRLKALNLKGKVIFDIGAHVGFHSFYFARLVGPQGKVYAFEPHPKNLERIQMTLEANKDLKKIVTVYAIALSNKKGEEEFSLNNDIESGRSSGGFIETAHTLWDKSAYVHRGFVKAKVRTIPLDKINELPGTHRNPDILKIDVEGAEAYVLQGAYQTILKSKPLMYIEIHSINAMFDVIKILDSLSYTTEIIHEEKDGRRFIEAKPR